ncbi:carbon storage regulator [Ferrimicrobium sp.]|uniref:carbon storage regulator n=1 Tax=Ferrimicrobium sp. TaxID=2926050 RepID=UPI00345CD31E
MISSCYHGVLGSAHDHGGTLLVLKRRVGESIMIGETITVEIVSVEGGSVHVGIDAPGAVEVKRGEREIPHCRQLQG